MLFALSPFHSINFTLFLTGNSQLRSEHSLLQFRVFLPSLIRAQVTLYTHLSQVISILLLQFDSDHFVQANYCFLHTSSTQGKREAHNSMASSSSYNSPCAACKFLRRKCMPGCIFAPYFPPEEPQKFANVHKIFGASNVSKLLNELLPHQRDDAVNSLAYEAEARVQDPVYGCVGAISSLQRQVDRLQKELDAANADLIRYACGGGVPAGAGPLGAPPRQRGTSGGFYQGVNSGYGFPYSYHWNGNGNGGVGGGGYNSHGGGMGDI